MKKITRKDSGKTTTKDVKKDVKGVAPFNIAPLPADHFQAGKRIAQELVKRNLIKGFTEEGANHWIWLDASGKTAEVFKEWIKTAMAVDLPAFRVFFQYSGKREAWYARSKGEIEIFNDAKYWHCAIKDKQVLNQNDSDLSWAQALLRATGKPNTWPTIEAKPALNKVESPKNEPLNMKDAIEALNKMGYKVVEG